MQKSVLAGIQGCHCNNLDIFLIRTYVFVKNSRDFSINLSKTMRC